MWEGSCDVALDVFYDGSNMRQLLRRILQKLFRQAGCWNLTWFLRWLMRAFLGWIGVGIYECSCDSSSYIGSWDNQKHFARILATASEKDIAKGRLSEFERVLSLAPARVPETCWVLECGKGTCDVVPATEQKVFAKVFATAPSNALPMSRL